MNLRNLFRVTAALSMIIGLVWLVAPKAIPASYGIDIDAYGAFYLQQLGAINVSLAVLFFLVSGMANSPARQAVVTFVIINQVLSGIVSLVAVLGNDLPAFVGLMSAAVNLVLALAFSYFRFLRPETSLAAEVQA